MASRATDFAFSRSADKASFANFATLSTVLAVGLEVSAGACTVGLAGGARHFALTGSTNLAAAACVVALTAVVPVILGVDALLVADLLTGEAGNDALSTLAHFTVFAGGVAGPTVFAVAL